MKIAVLVSGGVDSSVALHKLVASGADVTAFYLKIWLEDELAYLGSCPWQEDLQYIEATCAQLNVPLEVIPLQKEYFERVVSYTIEQVKHGLTPNPDVLCNQYVKFGAFYDAVGNAFDRIATGHYAARVDGPHGAELHMTPDRIKDQTYFLCRLSQEQLNRCLFPIGTLQKSEVRAYAEQHKLPAAMRKDSQGICFLGKISFPEFIKQYLGTKTGALIEFETGKQVGTHQGFWFYTVGQRSGIGLSGGPWYVVAKNPKENIVSISKSYHSPEKPRDTFFITDIVWYDASIPLTNNTMFVKIRHGAHLYTAHTETTDKPNIYCVKLSERDQGIAAGQYAAFYKNNRCLGSGRIINLE